MKVLNLSDKLIEALWQVRRQARKDKDFVLADEIMHLLLAAGYDVITRQIKEHGLLR